MPSNIDPSMTGGADSASVATIVRVMCDLVAQELGDIIDAELLLKSQLMTLFQFNSIKGTLNESVGRDVQRMCPGLIPDYLSSIDNANNANDAAFAKHAQRLIQNRSARSLPSDAHLHRAIVRHRLLAQALCNRILHTVYMGTVNSR